MVDPEVVLLYLAVNPDNSCYHYVNEIFCGFGKYS